MSPSINPRETQPLNAPDKELEPKQIVYMVPQEVDTDDEIDLFQLLLPPLKYKLQILLILMLGILISVAIVWYNKNAGFDNQIAEKIAGIQSELNRVELERKFALEDLNNSLANIPDEGTLYQIAGAEYRFVDKTNPGNIRVIHIDSYRDLSRAMERGGDEEEDNSAAKRPTEQPVNEIERDFDIFLKIEPIQKSLLKQQLSTAYEKLFVLNESITKLEYDAQVAQLQIYLLKEKKRESLTDQELQSTEEIDKRLQKQRTMLLQIESQLAILTVNQKNLLDEVYELGGTLSDNVGIETIQEVVPLSVWNDIKEQTEGGAIIQQERITELTDSVFALTLDEFKFKLLDYIYQQKIRVPVDAFEWPAFEYLAEVKPKSSVEYSIMGSGTAKTLVIGFVIALFIAVVSVYIRTFTNKVSENRALKNKVKTLTDAITYWKL